jgi:hypothetical protein
MIIHLDLFADPNKKLRDATAELYAQFGFRVGPNGEPIEEDEGDETSN